mmetsp:Transcript_37371/g.83169  ORF Transcript_37371/g.83169 Transcript_37371/m.83169 type:complete len:296 (+) Transcript_37371:122-1009(+)|eukprot:CAMPEP_0202894134 /NCGR_PEP_ID=MMETSP1392-20130828/3585_1 /ASSEMBLY_ACC=CAM_ASM_000868 /TAXON_ID=225041 /ORGANISM="Chlamydomonas chlamydogama, Strain SAG 11-48b" /LENGTH=295 /DNA_ID=CAMNT_0049578719 /DNA_START=104 /DNA_END=991 /DNA_ORIENTATION=-
MEDTRVRWERAFLEALEYDTWGQVEEAIEGYQRLQVAAAAEYVENVLQLSMTRRDGIGKLAGALKYRVQELQSSAERGVGLVGMKSIKPFMKDMIISDATFPLSGIKPETILGVGPITPGVTTEQTRPDFEEPAGSSDGTLRGPPTSVKRGDTTLTVFIEKWGLKDATPYEEVRVVTSVRDENGDVLEAVQETPIGKRTNSNYFFFENTVYIQTPLNRLPNNAAIFFEFRHWKAKKQKKSCKCYCYLEMDEIRSGPVTLEVYKKPPNYNRKKKPSLLSIKPFYLHLDLTVEERNF